ncbi:Bro-N domain-containing protein [Chromobacterium violaceum]|uniref:BRO-N domain-containing protein n=1 Tax=Chromobacterium violaceum TaxID=536 RepID=UPI003CF75BB1
MATQEQSNLPVAFNFGSHAIRTIEKDGEVWFVSTDVCQVLDIANPRNASARLDDDEKDAVQITDAIGRQQETTIINESGLYSLILNSRKPEARAFKRWVTHEVLPTIRKSGKYESPAKPEAAPSNAPRLPGRRSGSRDELSFTVRDSEGRLLNWFVPSRTNNWHEGVGIGQAWFDEIVSLARRNPKEAYDAMRFVGFRLIPYLGHGHEDGFFDMMSRWALAGIHAHHGGVPDLVKWSDMALPPQEGMEHYLRNAAPSKRTLSAAEEAEIERQALIDSADCILECIRRRRTELLEDRA